MADEETAADVCRRMAELRRDLSYDVRRVSDSARVMTDWTFYVRRFPWAMVAVAVAAGYLLIPKKKEVVHPDPDTIAELVKRKKIKVETKEHAADSPGVLKSLLMMGITWAAKAGMGYMGERMRTAATQTAQAGHRAAPAQADPSMPQSARSGASYGAPASAASRSQPWTH